ENTHTPPFQGATEEKTGNGMGDRPWRLKDFDSGGRHATAADTPIHVSGSGPRSGIGWRSCTAWRRRSSAFWRSWLACSRRASHDRGSEKLKVASISSALAWWSWALAGRPDSGGVAWSRAIGRLTAGWRASSNN